MFKTSFQRWIKLLILLSSNLFLWSFSSQVNPNWLTCAQGLMIALVDSFQSPLLFSLADCSFDGGDFVIVEVLQISSELLIQQ